MVEEIARASKVPVINTHRDLERDFGKRIWKDERTSSGQGPPVLWTLLACLSSRRVPCTSSQAPHSDLPL